MIEFRKSDVISAISSRISSTFLSVSVGFVPLLAFDCLRISMREPYGTG
jgi:hypothetical protein